MREEIYGVLVVNGRKEKRDCSISMKSGIGSLWISEKENRLGSFNVT